MVTLEQKKRRETVLVRKKDKSLEMKKMRKRRNMGLCCVKKK